MAEHNLTFSFPCINSVEIRLLHVSPALYVDEPLECNLVTYSQEKANNNYEALSYVWGSTEASHLLPTSVNGQILHITRNLESALRHLRYRSHRRTLWVDAICLNQNDLEEKTRVVPEMHHIYRSAAKVIAWIGKTVSGTESGLALLMALSEKWNEYINLNVHRLSFEDSGSDVASSDQSTIAFTILKLKRGELPKANDLQWQELENLFSGKDDWWDRVWTLQEAVSAKSYDLIWGQRVITDGTFKNAAELTCAMSYRGLVSAAELPRALLVFRKQMDTEKLRAMQKEGHSVSLATTLAASQFRSATNARDHLYGCLGLTSKLPLRQTVDYGKEILKVFEDATRALVEEGRDQSGGLNFLAACYMTRRDQLDTGMPSWTLLLDRKSGHASLCLPFGAHWNFDASGNHPAFATLTQQRKINGTSVLTVRGVLVDRIASVSRMVVPSNVSQVDDEGGNKIMAEFHDECAACIRHGQDIQILPSARSSYKNLIRILVCNSKAAIDSDQAVTLNWMSAGKSACFGRRFFLTNTGYMGLAPQAAEIGDWIFIVAGCDVPLILRMIRTDSTLDGRRDGNERTPSDVKFRYREDLSVYRHDTCYEIVGNVYVHGIMYGEGINLDKKGKPAFENIHIR